MFGLSKIPFKNAIYSFTWGVGALVLIYVSLAAVSNQQVKSITGVLFDLNHLSDGNDLITLDEIKEKVLKTYEFDLDQLEVDHVDLEDIEKLLSDEPFIAEAHTYIDAKQRLHVDITQRKPILRVMNLNGSDYYIGGDGIRLPLSQHFTARVPVITGFIPDFEIDFLKTDNALRKAFRAVNFAREDDFLNAWLEGIHLTQNGEMILLGNVGSFKVHLGSDDDLEEKVEKLKIFFRERIATRGWRHIDEINLIYENQVITKRKI